MQNQGKGSFNDETPDFRGSGMRSILIVRRAADEAAALASAADALAYENGLAPGPGHGVGKRVFACLSPPGAGRAEAEIDALKPFWPDGIVAFGVCGWRDIQRLGAKLAVREAELGLAAGATKIVAFPASTPAGVLELGTLARAGGRLIGLGFDADALAQALGVEAQAEPVRVARGLLVCAAAAAGVPAYERARHGDGDSFARACAEAARDSFFGLFVDDAAQAAQLNFP
jgi:citrate lyase subunit beta/citryl-CoA lyase